MSNIEEIQIGLLIDNFLIRCSTFVSATTNSFHLAKLLIVQRSSEVSHWPSRLGLDHNDHTVSLRAERNNTTLPPLSVNFTYFN